MKSTCFLLVFLLSSHSLIIAQSIGPRSPLGAYEQFGGCLSCQGAEWTNTSGIRQPDNNFVDVALYSWPDSFQSASFYSRYLFVTDFGFGIPTGAVILGIKAEMLRKRDSGAGMVTDSSVKLFCSNGPVGSDRANALPWSTTSTYQTYGDSTDTWGYSLSPDSTNRPEFGICIRVQNSATFAAPSILAQIDHVQMTIWYDNGTGIESQTASGGRVSAVYNHNASALSFYMTGRVDLKRLDVYNLNGSLLHSEATRSGTNPIQIPLQLPAGMYVWRSESGPCGKFIVQ